MTDKPMITELTVKGPNTSFKRIYEIANECFGMNYSGWMQALWPRENSVMPVSEDGTPIIIWAIKLYPNSSGCVNKISSDGMTLMEEITEAGKPTDSAANDPRDAAVRMTFAQEKPGAPYVFRGVFKIIGNTPKMRVYERAADTVVFSEKSRYKVELKNK